MLTFKKNIGKDNDERIYWTLNTALKTVRLQHNIIEFDTSLITSQRP